MTTKLEIAAFNYEAEKKRLIELHPWLAEDQETLMDTLEGCTDLREAIAEVVRAAKIDEALSIGLSEYITALEARKFDHDQRAKAKRSIAFRYMSEHDIRSIKAPDHTISIRRIPPGVIIENENIIPEKFQKITKTPNKTAIKKALEAGDDVPGATLSNGGETISITT